MNQKDGASAPFAMADVAGGRFWQAGRFRIDLTRAKVMAIVNLTPDSFSDGGALPNSTSALRHCERLVRDGADLLDLGGESTRPGSQPVSAEEELSRVLPVLRSALGLGVPVSVDTHKPDVMRRVLAEGADVLNDIHALRTPGALEIVAAHGTCGVCLMHLPGSAGELHATPPYQDIVVEVRRFLASRGEALRSAGIDSDRIVYDPGIGFGKSVRDNLELLRRQAELCDLDRPLLLGWSRKSTLGAVTGRSVDKRQSVSVAAALLSVQRGARVVRVHDVAATVDALKLWEAVGSSHR